MKKIYSIFTIVCLIIGILIGCFAPDFAKTFSIYGNVYIDALKILIGPVIFCSIALTIIKHKKGDSILVFKTIGLFVLMFFVTFCITSVIVVASKPGLNFTFTNGADATKQADFNVGSIFMNLIPKEFVTFIKGGNIFFVIIFALIISLIIKFTPAKNVYQKGVTFVKKYLDIALKAVIAITPIAVVCLVSNMIATYGNDLLSAGFIYILMAYACSLVAIVVVMLLPVWIFGKINPLKYISKVAKVWLVSLSTCSSVATLPYTIKCCNEDFGIDEKITNIVVPLGCTIHMCGGAASFSLLGLFVAQMTGVVVTFPMFLLMVVFATLINMAAPGIPGGGVVIGISYLSLLGLPINGFYGFYAGIYKLLDMSYTTLNVTGDISANILLDRIEKRKTIKKINKQKEQN